MRVSRQPPSRVLIMRKNATGEGSADGGGRQRTRTVGIAFCLLCSVLQILQSADSGKREKKQTNCYGRGGI